LDWVGLGYVGLDWVGLGYVGLDWVWLVRLGYFLSRNDLIKNKQTKKTISAQFKLIFNDLKNKMEYIYSFFFNFKVII